MLACEDGGQLRIILQLNNSHLYLSCLGLPCCRGSASTRKGNHEDQVSTVIRNVWLSPVNCLDNFCDLQKLETQAGEDAHALNLHVHNNIIFVGGIMGVRFRV